MVDPNAMLGPLDILGTNVIYVLLVLVVVNMGLRFLAYNKHVRQADTGGAEALSRYYPLEATNVLLILGSFYYLTVAPHGGMVMSVLVVGMVLADFFEFEARKVEARKDDPLERPKSALVASLLVLGYAAFQSLFVYVAPIWNSIV